LDDICSKRFENFTSFIKVSILDPIQWSKLSWERISKNTIKNCFLSTGLFAEIQMPNIEDLGNKFNILKENDFDVCDINEDINLENKC